MKAVKTPKESAVITRQIVMPQHANPHNALFGGQLVSWIDTTAAMVAQRHSGRMVVTASIDQLVFQKPIHVGDHLILEASVNFVGRSSMEIGVRVSVENPWTGKTTQATKAYLTFVALDENDHPTAVPALKPESVDEKRRFENAKIRVEARKELLAKLKSR